MMGKAVQREAKLFHVGFDLDQRVPPEHPLRRIDQAVDFCFVRAEVASLYGYNGQESIDPTLVLKLMFLCFYENLRSERELMRQLPLRLDWLWFCGLDLDSAVPDHSVLSKARRRWGPRLFQRLFTYVLELCRDAGLVAGRTLHADSTLLRASASLESRVSRALWEQLEQGREPAAGPGAEEESAPPPQPPACPGQEQAASAASQPPAGARPGKPAKIKRNDWLVSPVDPDAAISTRKAGGTTLGYRDHRLIDDRCGVILATVATGANVDDGAMLPELLDRQQEHLPLKPAEVVGDSMYGTQANYAQMKERKIKAYLKKRRGKDSPRVSWLWQLPADCAPGRALQLLGRRKAVAEGSFAEAHRRMNHRRCRWRRQWRVQIQCYLVAAVQNAKRLIGQSRSWRRAAACFLYGLELKPEAIPSGRIHVWC